MQNVKPGTLAQKAGGKVTKGTKYKAKGTKYKALFFSSNDLSLSLSHFYLLFSVILRKEKLEF